MKACIHVLGDAGYVWDADGEVWILVGTWGMPLQLQQPLLPPLPPPLPRCTACPTPLLLSPQSLTGCAWSAALWAPWLAAWRVSTLWLYGCRWPPARLAGPRLFALACLHPLLASACRLPHPTMPPACLHLSTPHAAFKQQNAVHGLPLELSAEEVTLAVEKGWAELAPVLDTAALAAALGASGRKRARQSAYQYYDEEDEDLDADMADAAAQQQQPAAEPTWRPALASGATFVIPTTVAEAAAANEGRSLDNGSGAADAAAGSAAAAAAAGGAAAAAAAGGAAADAGGAAGSASAAQWTFPSSREERHCYWVFRDLHSRG